MSKRVLVIDDDEALAENVAEIVGTLGVETSVARDGKAALALADSHDFDVALIDVRLPDGDGVSLLEPLRARSAFTQLVLVTGNATLDGAIAAVRGDAFAYVLKPLAPADLLDTVRRAMGQAALYRERERLRVDLERSERRYRELVEAIPAFILALDQHGRISTWNRALEQVTGYSRDEMLSVDGSALVGPQGGRPRELPLKGGGSRKVKVRWSRAEVPDVDGAPLVYAVGIDVSDEEEMLRRTLRAERLAAVGTMAAGLAHEIRNPLNSASLQLAVLDRRLEKGKGPESTRPITRIIQGEIERLEGLVRDFLAFAKPSPLQARPVDLAELMGGVAELIGPETATAGISLIVEAPAGMLPAAGDPGRLRQVLLNLTRNAMEAMQGQDKGGRIILRAAPGAETVEMQVEDDGPGFPDSLPVFDAFFTTKDQGTGLGLSLVHRIVSDHGGTIRVESRPGRTCFIVTLPVAR